MFCGIPCLQMTRTAHIAEFCTEASTIRATCVFCGLRGPQAPKQFISAISVSTTRQFELFWCFGAPLVLQAPKLLISSIPARRTRRYECFGGRGILWYPKHENSSYHKAMSAELTSLIGFGVLGILFVHKHQSSHFRSLSTRAELRNMCLAV